MTDNSLCSEVSGRLQVFIKPAELNEMLSACFLDFLKLTLIFFEAKENLSIHTFLPLHIMPYCNEATVSYPHWLLPHTEGFTI